MKDRWTVAINHGRMTIPAELRRKYGLHPGDRVWIEEHDGKIFITPERRDEAKVEHQTMEPSDG